MFKIATEPDDPIVITPPPVLARLALQFIVEELPAVIVPVELLVKLPLVLMFNVLPLIVNVPILENDELFVIEQVAPEPVVKEPLLVRAKLVVNINVELDPIVEDPDMLKPPVLFAVKYEDVLITNPSLMVKLEESVSVGPALGPATPPVLLYWPTITSPTVEAAFTVG